MEHASQKIQEIEKYWKWYQINRFLGAMGGAVVYALGINLFIVPVSLYSGGIMGFAQVIRTVLVEYMHLPVQNFDVAGVIYYLINAPILLLSMKRIGRRFFAKTVLCVTIVTVLLSVIPIPAQPILPDDTLACCVIGGIICGLGMGIALKCGGSLGGTDIVGMMLIKWRRDFRVGRVNMTVNVLLYGICLFLFNVPTVIYSLIYAFVSAFAIDKVHAQTINVEVRVITKKKDDELEKEIFAQLDRGVTKWEAVGAYTDEPVHVLYILASKYELSQLKNIVYKHDPHAFVVIDEGVSVVGNYKTRL
ncbi:MAG TPA: YitT family protein [Candidatus Eisenbergiella merdavium]|uniref:YitT family protein n=1 Tax=Candidatus Eisenbergiella merdavium TaxID=2838551 RepID=A0A9D2NG91_9FIRM|nr:YitT family protein [Candidatus Eisenbergiella merdavium]